MSFQAYLDAIEAKTGRTPRQLLGEAIARGYQQPGVKPGFNVQCLADEHGLARGHAMAMVHVITKGPQISSKHVGSDGVHRDETDTLWLDGVATKPQG